MSKLLTIGTALPDPHNRFTQVSLTAPVHVSLPVHEDVRDADSLADMPPPVFSHSRARKRSSMNVRYTKRSRVSNAWAMA